ncbi:hypothetical protein BH11MYX1_BH11MYX1_33770 [soil metagenome]
MIERDDPSTIPAGSAGGAALVTTRLNPRLIIADDSAEMRWLVRSTLEQQFPDVVEAEDGRQLLSLLLRTVFAARAENFVLIVDVKMPVYSGLEVLAAWHSADYRIPVVVITSFPDEAVCREVDRLGAALLSKPFSRATLRRVVTDAAQRARQHPQSTGPGLA